MMQSPCCGKARPWEYKYRALVLFGSQPLLATLHWCASGFTEEWGNFPVPLTTGLWAVAIGTAGLLLRIWATGAMSASVMASSTPNTDRLVNEGPYALCRNSLYIGTLLIFGAYGIFFGWGWALAYFVFHLFRYVRIIAYEEGLLRDSWGAAFERYCEAVPRWIPRLRGLKSGTLGNVSWIDGVFGNSVFAGMVLGYAAATWTRSLGSLIPFEVGGFVLAGLYLRFNRRTRISEPTTEDGSRVPVAAAGREHL